MSNAKSEEQRLYADLTRLMTKLRNEPLATVESVIEERFRAYIRAGKDAPNKLQITMTWALPEGADAWAMYGTEYHLAAAETLVPAPPPVAEMRPSENAVIPFPAARPHGGRTDRQAKPATGTAAAKIFSFPKECSPARNRA